MNRAAPELYLGLMSGTSADGIDAALVEFSDVDGRLHVRLHHAHTTPWPDDLRVRLIELGQGGDARSLEELGMLDVRVGEAFADAALQLLRNAQMGAASVRAIGSHGQTVRHRPLGAHGDGIAPFTMQLGDGNVIAERSGITTVCDFRRRDVAAGGQGAPLLPALHAALLQDADEDRAVLNLGGIGNLTLLPRDGEVRGFDTGPANALLDAWCERHTGQSFDADGAWAASGEIDHGLLHTLLSDPWFAQAPPKSTGREQFHLDWLMPHLHARGLAAQDVQATLLQLTAATVADALLATQANTQCVLVCGGGVHNPVLMDALRTRLPGMRIEATSAHGIDPDAVEAMGFAWLARQTLLGLPGNLPSVTGARGPRVLGAIHPA